jgi:hypothetical protein
LNNPKINIYQKMLELYRSAWCSANLAELILYVVKTNPRFPENPILVNLKYTLMYRTYITEVMRRYQLDSKILLPVLYCGPTGEKYINYNRIWDSRKPAHYVHIMKSLNIAQKQYCLQYIDYYKDTNTDINATWVDKYVDIAEILVDTDKYLLRSR